MDFSFVSSGAVTGGAPRFSIPIDVDENGSVNGYAFIDAANSVGNPAALLVGTTNPTSKVFFGNETHDNWDAFAGAHPTYRVAPGAIPFIIADGAYDSTYMIGSINLH